MRGRGILFPELRGSERLFLLRDNFLSKGIKLILLFPVLSIHTITPGSTASDQFISLRTFIGLFEELLWFWTLSTKIPAVPAIVTSHIVIADCSIVCHESCFILVIDMFQIILLPKGTLERDMAVASTAFALLARGAVRGLLNVERIYFVVSVDSSTV